ncbi:MAG: ABC-F family ATP-binding cassette domain-containing protein, partial [Clostridiaceae bacterium]|nr:ABC-F family ATP-binding cassette domain-containing protein [Clostridiaceae bacterium]
LANLYEEYNSNGGNEYKNRVRSILQGLGFPEESWNMQISTLSGGQKTRLALARLLVKTPDVLVLDEPTNHLDTQSIEWLESFLKSYQGTLLVISHDRQLLTTVTNKTLLIDNQEAYMYNAPYDKYVALREADKAYQEKCFIQQQKEIERIMAFVEQQKR